MANYDHKDQPDYIAPPAGQRYVRQNGKVVIDTNGSPMVTKSKKAGKRNRSKPARKQYSIPVGGLQSSETPDYNPDVHLSLRARDFADPLHFAQWKRDQIKLSLQRAEKDIEQLTNLGTTTEERLKRAEDVRVVKQLENLLIKRRADKSSLEHLTELIAALLATYT